MITESDYGIVYNGEIYNYLELRDELKKNGYIFTTQTDTEVLLAAYDCWQESCVEKFNGMWAFVIYDKKRDMLFCSRDRFGVKPFYYYLKDGKFIFSSELKGILEHQNLGINQRSNLNKEAIELYFSLGFIPAPHTIYKDVFKLPAGHNLAYNLKNRTITNSYKYYALPKFAPITDKRTLIDRGRALLDDAIKLRMRSDVEVGALLSGGLDSSSVVSGMRKYTSLEKLHTFSIGFKEKGFDETPYVDLVKDAFKTRHHHRYFYENDFNDLFTDYLTAYDEPFGDYSGFATLSVSELAHENATVILSGDGGDEVFGGYDVYRLGRMFELLKKFPLFMRKLGAKIPAKKNLNKYLSLYTLKEACRISQYPKYRFYSKALEFDRYKPESFVAWTEMHLKESLELADGNFLEALRIYDLLYQTLADHFLTKLDRASMAYQVEVRSPYLDYRFIEFSQQIPSQYKLNLRKGKILMREINKDLVPKEILLRGKQGFTPPIEKWILESKYSPQLDRYLLLLNDLNSNLHNYFKSKVFQEDNRLYNIDKIRLLVFGLWYDAWVHQ